MRIVDVHTHLGPDRLFGLSAVTPEALVAAMDRTRIDVALAMPQPGVEDPVTEHDRIAEAASRWPGRIFGIALPDLRGRADAYWREAERCVKQLGFVALKFHTAGHAVSPASDLGRLPFEVASALEVPLMIHTGFQLPSALPSLAGARANAFPNLRVVLAHAGMAPFWYEAVEVARANPNIYLETSWVPVYALQRMVTELGAERVLFGSDLILNIGVELAKYDALELAEADRQLVLGGAAERLFNMPVSA
jgi:uncharacterized protein